MNALKIKHKTGVETVDIKTMNILLKQFERKKAEYNKLDKELKTIKTMLQHLETKRFSTADYHVDIKRKRREYILSKDEMIEILGDDYKQYAKTKLIWHYNIIKKVG